MTGFAFDTAGIGFDNSIYGYDGVVAPGHNNAAWTNNGGALSTVPNAPSLSFNAGQTVTPTGTSMFMTGGTPTVTVTANTGPSGQLAAGHWIAAKMPLTATRIVHPRPDSETTAAAYHRNAHPSVQYVCPIFIQGGAYPFWFDIISAPAGATIGRRYSDTDYGVIRWTPTSGIQTFVVRVYDQDGSIVDITWSVSVNSTWVSFIDAVNGNDANAGTFAAPWATYAKAIAAVSGGKAVCARLGTYNMPAAAVALSSAKHNSLFAYPNEAVTFNCATSTVDGGCWAMGSTDTWVAGISCSGGPTVPNPRYFLGNSVCSRSHLWKVSFDNPVQGSAGAGAWDNQACWWLQDPGAQRVYNAMVGCTFSRLPPSGNGFMAIDTYQCKYLLVADNIFGTPHSSLGEQYSIFIKGAANNEISVRGNTWNVPWAPANAQVGLYFGGDGSTGGASNNQEICYNKIVNTVLNTWNSFAVIVNNAQNNSNHVTAWSYRNTVYGIFAVWYQSINTLTFSSENDVVINNTSVVGSTGKIVAVNQNDAANAFRNPTTIPGISYTIGGTECHGVSSAGILDASYNLTGISRTNYLGLRGCEIA